MSPTPGNGDSPQTSSTTYPPQLYDLQPKLEVEELQCPICFNLDIDRGTPKPALNTTTVGALRASAQTCSNCQLLASACRLARSWAPTQISPKDKVNIIFQFGRPLRLESQFMKLELFLNMHSTIGLPCLGEANTVSVDLTAEDAARIARRWLQTCQDEHKVCGDTRARYLTQPGPRRLLDLKAHHIGTGLRLVETSEIGVAPYTALSYCWGTQGNTTTTRATLRDRMKSVDYLSLPKTIRDAIDVTRCLGFRYLWVDALCIVQDDVDDLDWRSESTKMDSIYGGAVMTLSATRSSSVYQGFLLPRTNESAQEQSSQSSVPWTNQDGEVVKVFVRQRLPHDILVPDDSSLDRYPLLKRGWGFQERLLSLRTLYFLPHEMVWECRCDFRCECGGAEGDRTWKARRSLFSRTLANPQIANLSFVWQSLVQEYSRRLLSRPEDRLPALAVVARQYQEVYPQGGAYLAGLWEGDLVRHLLWQVDHDQMRKWREDKRQWKVVEDKKQRTEEPRVATEGAQLDRKRISLFLPSWATRFTDRRWSLPGRRSHMDFGPFDGASVRHQKREGGNNLVPGRERTLPCSLAVYAASCATSPNVSSRKALGPSWSWASAKYPIMWPVQHFHVDEQSPLGTEMLVGSKLLAANAVILAHDLKRDEVNPFGAVYSGRLVLQSVIVPATLTRPYSDTWGLSLGTNNSMPGTSGWNDVVFIPDGTIEDLSLVQGNTIHCARITCYLKDGNPMTVGLGLYQSKPEFETTVYPPDHRDPENQVLIEYHRVGLIVGTGWRFESLFGGKLSTIVVC